MSVGGDERPRPAKSSCRSRPMDWTQLGAVAGPTPELPWSLRSPTFDSKEADRDLFA
jgi:hypothetical protein